MATSTNARRRGAKPEPEKDSAPVRQKRKPSKVKRFLRAVLLILILVAASVGATLYYTWPAGSALFGFLPPQDTAEEPAPAEQAVAEKVAPEPPAAPLEKPLFLKLDPFTVTLNDGGNRSRIMHVAITLQITNEASGTLLYEYMPVVRDRVLKILSEQHPAHVQTPEGREQLVDSLTNALRASYDQSLTKPQISNVLFTAFVIQ